LLLAAEAISKHAEEWVSVSDGTSYRYEIGEDELIALRAAIAKARGEAR